ncbi:hypothetical protein J5N97_010698 [Dioscorea zingiberensis]|uniref:Uncharacterized protein n=1 Tax=Dioscorea zingiberensis TaxID=325984 RepID=A0A9D5HMW9_9LILI|nr:hypothetical protein J5N97_010698 [Dioscorea zingiberensis]
MGNEMGNRNVNGLQASEQDDTLASTEIYESMKASVVSNNAEDFKDLKKDDIEVITAKGSSNPSTIPNDDDDDDDDGVLKDMADDLEGDVEEHKTLTSKENSTFSMESDGADELKDQKQHEVEETTANESLKSSMVTNNAEGQVTVTDYLEDNLLEKDEIEEGSRNEFSEALIVSSEEQVGKSINQAIVSMQSLKSDEKHTNSIPDVPSATDEEDLIQGQTSETKADDTIMVSIPDTQSRTDKTSPTISTYNEHEEKTSNEGMPASSDEKGVTMEDTNVDRPNVADSSVLDLAVEDGVSKKEAEENNEVEEQQCPQSDKFGNDSEQSQILESINSACLDAIDSEIKRLVISNDLIAFDESVNKNTEAILKDNVLKEIIQTVETKEVVSSNLNEQEKLSSLVWEDCNEIGADTSPAEFSAGELEEKVQDGGERSQGKAETIDLGEANKEENDGELEGQTVEAEEVVTSKSNQQDELPSLVFEECNEIRADVSLAEFSVGECRSSKDSGHPVSESWNTNDASVFTDIEGKTEDIDAKEITEEITEKLNQVLPNAPMFEETLTQINSRETAVVLSSSQTEVHGAMNLPEAMSTAQESEQLHTALESELQANMESLISSVSEDGNTLTESFSAASQTENQKQWRDVIHASPDKMAVQQAGGSVVEKNEIPHVLEENIEESQSSKDATSESTQENLSSEAANTTIASGYLESSHAEIQPSELQSLNLALETIVHESEENSAGNIDAVKAKAVKFEDNPSMDQEKTIRCDVFAIRQDISKTGAESSFSVLQSDNDESDKSPLLYQKNAREGELSNLERSDSGKLRAPLLRLMKEEVHAAEPVEKEEGFLIKKTIEEVWKSPAKKSMATSPRTREKPKPRSSIFSNCMCCTTAALN